MNFNKNKRIENTFDVCVSKSKGIKRLIVSNKRSFGRPFGKILSWHIGGGVKRKYRIILNKMNLNNNNYGVIKNIIYDPFKTAFISNIQLQDGSFSTILTTSNMKINDVINLNNCNIEKLSVGDYTELRYMPLGVPIYNLEQYPGKGSSFSKAAGAGSFLISKSSTQARIKLPSGQERFFDLDCRGTVGIPSNINHKFKKKYKAGTTRLLNKRPTVRGVAMNPIDHPHGGGEGKTSGGRPSVSPWGKLTKNVPTRNKKKINKLILK